MEMNYDAKVDYSLTPLWKMCSTIIKELHQIEEEPRVEILPRTELMADIRSHNIR